MTAFDLVPVVIGEYENHRRLDRARDEAERVAGLLAEHLESRAVWWTADEQRTATSVNRQLAQWAGQTDGRNSLLLWMGHGTSDGRDAWLATYETPPVITGSGVNPYAIAEQIALQWSRRAARPGSWALVVIEACGAGTFVRNVAKAVLDRADGPRRVGLVGVGGEESAGNLGQFGRILEAVLAGYTDNDGDEIPAWEFVSNLRDRAGSGRVFDIDLHLAEGLPRRRLLPSSVQATLEDYGHLQHYLAALPDDQRGHFIPKAQGAEQGELAWYFVGRHAERRELSAWLRGGGSGVLVVTGPAGSGKSALLGNLLVHTNKTLRDLLIDAGQLEAVPDRERPPDDAFDAVVHLTGMTAAALTNRLAEAAGVPWADLPAAERTSRALVRALRERGRTFTVLADALDEAQDAYAIARHVLTEIADVPGCRVVVGTRASLHDDPDGPAASGDLLAIFTRDREPRILLVDRDETAISTYVERRLAAARKARTIGVGDDRIREAAELIRGKNRQFLFARLAVHELLARPWLLDPGHRDELDVLLRGDHRQLFATAVARLGASSPAVVPLLAALAFAQGRGVPRSGRVWAVMAGALHPAGDAVGEDDIDRLAKAAAPYIMLDAEHEQSVYRLAHRTFQEHFLAGADPVDTHRRLAHALIAAAGRDERRALNDYLARHLPAHVARGDVWADLANDPDLLDLVDADAVAAEVLGGTAEPGDLPPEINAISRSLHVLARAAPEDRRLIRSVTAGRYGGRPPAAGAGFWELGWARLHGDAPHVPINCGQGAVLALAPVTVNGVPLLATGGSDGSVRLWDPRTGRPYGERFTAHSGTVRALLQVSSGDGRRLLASAGDDGVIRIWDPHTERLTGEPLSGHDGPVLALAEVLRDGRRLLVSAGEDGLVRLWDVARRRLTEPILAGHDRPVEQIAVIDSMPFGPALQTRDADGQIFDWRLDSGVHDDIGADAEFLITADVSGAAAFVSVQTPAFRRQLHVDWPGGVRGTRWREWEDGPRPISAAASLGPLGGIVAIAAGETGEITLWHPAGGHPAGRSLTGHSGPVRAMVCTGPRLLASAGDDGTLRLWRRLDTTGRDAPRPGVATTVRTPVFAVGGGRHIARLAGEGDGPGYVDARTGLPVMDDDYHVALRSVDVANWQVSLKYTAGRGDRATSDPYDSALRDSATDYHGLEYGTFEIAGGLTLPDGGLVLVAALPDGPVRLWSPDVEDSRRYLRGHLSGITALTVATASTGQRVLVTGSGDRTVRHWYLDTGRKVCLARGTAATVRGLARLPGRDGEGDRVVSVAGHGMHLWDVDDPERQPRLIRLGAAGDYTGVAAVGTAAGGCLVVASLSTRRLIAWDPATERVVRTIELDAELRGVAGAGDDLLVDSDAGPFVLRVRPGG